MRCVKEVLTTDDISASLIRVHPCYPWQNPFWSTFLPKLLHNFGSCLRNIGRTQAFFEIVGRKSLRNNGMTVAAASKESDDISSSLFRVVPCIPWQNPFWSTFLPKLLRNFESRLRNIGRTQAFFDKSGPESLRDNGMTVATASKESDDITSSLIRVVPCYPWQNPFWSTFLPKLLRDFGSRLRNIGRTQAFFDIVGPKSLRDALAQLWRNPRLFQLSVICQLAQLWCATMARP